MKEYYKREIPFYEIDWRKEFMTLVFAIGLWITVRLTINDGNLGGPLNGLDYFFGFFILCDIIKLITYSGKVTFYHCYKCECGFPDANMAINCYNSHGQNYKKI